MWGGARIVMLWVLVEEGSSVWGGGVGVMIESG